MDGWLLNRLNNHIDTVNYWALQSHANVLAQTIVRTQPNGQVGFKAIVRNPEQLSGSWDRVALGVPAAYGDAWYTYVLVFVPSSGDISVLGWYDNAGTPANMPGPGHFYYSRSTYGF